MRACFSYRIVKDGRHDRDIHSLRQDRRNLASVSGRVKWRRAWNPAFGAASSRRAAAQVRQVVHAQTLGNFPQPGSAGGEETAQQPARGQLPQPRLPVLGVAAQPLEDPGQLTGDRGFARAEQPPGILHQEQVIAQRESLLAQVASNDSSSRIATLLNRPSKNAPRVCSSRLASRESGSFKHFMNQLRLCNRSRALATHLASFSRAWTHSSETGATCRALSRGGKRRPQRRTTSSSDQLRATSGSSRTSRCKWLSRIANPATATAKISASSSSRCSIQLFRSCIPSPSRKARRTQRVTQ